MVEFVWHCIFIDPLALALSIRYVLLSLLLFDIRYAFTFPSTDDGSHDGK